MTTGAPADLRLLADRLEALAALPAGEALPPHAEQLVDDLLGALEEGAVRAAAPDGAGRWHAVPWIKRGILLAFRAGRIVPMPAVGAPSADEPAFFDKHTVPPRRLAATDDVRVVPGGSSIRRGAHVGRGVVCMPPMFVNVGAFVGAASMIDSHALVGSCAQIGERVHLSAAAQIGGVLEPVNAAPVVVEDEVLIGGNCGVYEGTIVRRRAVLAAGVTLTRGTPVYDLVRQTIYRATAQEPLEIPASAVVVPGSRPIRSGWGGDQGLSLQTPVIVKYRDDKTDAATALEDWLR